MLPIITNDLYKKEFLYEASMILTDDGKMSAENLQNKNFAISKNFATAQDVFGAIAFILAVIQGITAVIPAKSFLVIAGIILVLEYVSAYYKSSFLIKDIVSEKWDLLIIVLRRKEFQTIIVNLIIIILLY